MLATLAFAVVPVQDSSTKEWSFMGVLQNPGQYFVVTWALVWGTGALSLHLPPLAGQPGLCPPDDGGGCWPLPALFGMVHIGIGKFGQWHTDSDLVERIRLGPPA